MSSLGEELRRNHAAIVQRWYDLWRVSPHPRHDVSEAALKDSLDDQLRLIGEQLADLATAEDPERLWRVTARLDPEARVGQEIPIEEVVQEYGIAIDVVRTWVAERGIAVSFDEYSYFYRAMFELTAESVRRYVNQQAENVRRQRAEYLAAVMHQLRTPLTTLSLQIEILARGEEGKQYAVLRRSVRRIRLLVDGILRLERFQSWETPIRPQDVRPAQLVDGILEDHEREAARKGLRFEARVDPSLRMTIDPDLFLDALENLVHNAVKYTTQGHVVVDADEEPDFVTFRVSDTGPGIPTEKQKTLFQGAQPGSIGGAGIGLLIAQHAARAQGGSIDFQSEPGRGSVFALRLPRAVAAREGSAARDG